MKTATAALALLLACIALQACDRRQTDGHSTTPPEQGAATEAPAEAPADQSVQPAEPQSAEAPAGEPDTTQPPAGQDDGG